MNPPTLTPRFSSALHGLAPVAWGVEAAAVVTPFQRATTDFALWSGSLAGSEQLFDRHVYHNPDITALDVRRHRAGLHQLIAEGEALAVKFLALEMPDESASYLTFIDAQVQRLNGVLRHWHGDPELAADTPESLKEAMREYANRQTAPMEADLFGSNEPEP